MLIETSSIINNKSVGTKCYTWLYQYLQTVGNPHILQCANGHVPNSAPYWPVNIFQKHVVPPSTWLIQAQRTKQWKQASETLWTEKLKSLRRAKIARSSVRSLRNAFGAGYAQTVVIFNYLMQFVDYLRAIYQIVSLQNEAAQLG